MNPISCAWHGPARRRRPPTARQPARIRCLPLPLRTSQAIRTPCFLNCLPGMFPLTQILIIRGIHKLCVVLRLSSEQLPSISVRQNSHAINDPAVQSAKHEEKTYNRRATKNLSPVTRTRAPLANQCEFDDDVNQPSCRPVCPIRNLNSK